MRKKTVMRTFAIHQQKTTGTSSTPAEEINAAYTRAIRKNMVPEFTSRLSSVIVDISGGAEPGERIKRLLDNLRNE